jgi:hypothetical protein
VTSNVAWFLIAASLFWVLPVVAFRPAPTTLLLLTWDYTLAAYSYGVDTKGKPVPSRTAFLFFLLVNPALVYRHRGERVAPAGLNARGLARVLAGVVAIVLSLGVFRPWAAWALATAPDPRRWLARIVTSLSRGGLRLAGDYSAQWGIASVQLGYMRQLGHRLPERFLHPLAARSPADFWRRWNVYVGAWARLYVFAPLAARLRRGAQGLRTTYAVAVLVTFAMIGAFHDVFSMSNLRRPTVEMTAWFSSMGILIVVWEALFASLRPRWPIGSRHLERLFFVLAVCGAAAGLPR